MDKTLLEPREMVRPKEVCFSESSLRTGDRTRSSYYLNVGGAEKGASTPQFSPGSQGPRGFTPTPQWSRSELHQCREGRAPLGRSPSSWTGTSWPTSSRGVTRLYGLTISNIPEKIRQTSIKSLDGSVDEKQLRCTWRSGATTVTCTRCLASPSSTPPAPSSCGRAARAGRRRCPLQ
ncbi:Speriolin-like protein [Manis javanica]|nr:Speriolin-like protein [Manis javanica]